MIFPTGDLEGLRRHNVVNLVLRLLLSLDRGEKCILAMGMLELKQENSYIFTFFGRMSMCCEK